jgi:hypothetical protein
MNNLKRAQRTPAKTPEQNSGLYTRVLPDRESRPLSQKRGFYRVNNMLFQLVQAGMEGYPWFSLRCLRISRSSDSQRNCRMIDRP